jgi:hypothetical protein
MLTYTQAAHNASFVNGSFVDVPLAAINASFLDFILGASAGAEVLRVPLVLNRDLIEP